MRSTEYTPELIEALEVLSDEPEGILERIDAALAEVRPDLIGTARWYAVPGTDRQAVGVPCEVSDEDSEVIQRAYLIAGGTHWSCAGCLLEGRGPLCAAGDCTGGVQ